MHIEDLLADAGTMFSFELFPARNPEGAAKLASSLAEVERFGPSFVSVTYGAGGSTRERTLDLVLRLKESSRLDPIPHLTCVGQSQQEITEILERYAVAGISNLLALRGDLPREIRSTVDGYARAADLVRAIRAFAHHPDRRGFGIGVAGYPEGHPGTPNRLLEMDHLKAKVDAGANYICTQLFFDNRDFFDFRERCELAGIQVPILAGLMPVSSLAGLNRIAELAGGARFPARLLKRLARANMEAATVERIGNEYATEQCADLLQHGVAGIHFYILNQARGALEILRNLGVSAPRAGFGVSASRSNEAESVIRRGGSIDALNGVG